MTQERITFPNLKCSSSDMRETKKLLQIYRIFHYTPRKTCLGYAWPFTNPVFCRSIVVAHKPPKILGPVQTLHFKRDRNKERHLLWETDQERRDLESCVLHGVLVQKWGDFALLGKTSNIYMGVSDRRGSVCVLYIHLCWV